MQHSLTTETYSSAASKTIHRILQTRNLEYTHILSRNPHPHPHPQKNFGPRNPCTVNVILKRVWQNPVRWYSLVLNPLTPNDPYSGRTAPLTFKVAFHIFNQQI